MSGLSVLQSCKKDEEPAPLTFVAAMPANPDPGNTAIVPFSGTPVTLHLKWEATATNPIKWDIYFGNTDKPSKVASNVSGNTYDVTVNEGGTYYWKVSTVDENKVTSTSDVWSVVVNSNPDVPTIVGPKMDSIGAPCTPTISWEATDPEGDDLTYDLYLGKTATPAIAYADLTESEISIATSLSESTAYYWKVVAKDPYGGRSESPVWKFTTGLEPINTFVGLYNADEPAEAYSYDVTFTKVNSTTIQTDNYWNSNPWVGKFTLDLTKLTYAMPLTTWTSGYSGIESGIIDPKTGTMTGTYTIWKNGKIVEQGVHTYTKK